MDRHALADRIFAVNPAIVTRLERLVPRAARKAEVMTVSVDTRRFAASPFDCADKIFRILFAGRLDEFKDPPLMFSVLADLFARLAGKLEFHYAGTTDPARYREFGGIAPFTTCHGFLTPDAVAELAGNAMPAFSPPISRECPAISWKHCRSGGRSAPSACRNMIR